MRIFESKMVSWLFLFLVTIIVLSVLSFSYYSSEYSLVQNGLTFKSIIKVDKEDSLGGKSFFSHDVLIAKHFCDSPGLIPREYRKLLSTFGDQKKCYSSLKEINLLEEENYPFGFNLTSILFLNERLDYRFILEYNSEFFRDLISRIEKHRSYLEEEVSMNRRDELSSSAYLTAVFDRKNPENVYILLNIQQQYFWGSKEEPSNDIASYSAEFVVYKYNLITEEYEKLYDTYDFHSYKTDLSVRKSDNLLLGKVRLVGINNDNDLLIAGNEYYGVTGLGGGDLAYSFEELSLWTNLYLLENNASELKEYKYTEDDSSYNADLYNFLMFKYYPAHFDMNEYIDIDIYQDL